jgi:hypothetical protein
VYQILRINDFGSNGLNTDLPAAELPPGFVTDGRNFCVINGNIRTRGGFSFGSDTPADFKFMYPMDADRDVWILFSDTECYLFDGNSFTDITGAIPLDPDAYSWVGTSIGRISVFSSESNYPMYLSDTSGNSTLSDLPYDVEGSSTWRSVGLVARSIRSVGQFLVAMNITDGGTHYPDLIHWSHPADVGGLPNSWDYFRDDRLANRVALGGNGGDIIDGFALRDGMQIYRHNGISTLNLTRDEYVFSIRHLTEIASAANVRSIVEIKGAHFVMTNDDIVVNDGNSVQSIVHHKIRRAFIERLNGENIHTAYAMKNPLAKEIWFCIPETSELCTTAFIYNWRDDSWAVRDLPSVRHSDFGVVKSESKTWDAWLELWNASTGIWNQGRTSVNDKSVVACSPVSTINLDIEFSNSEGGTEFNTYIYRDNLAIAGHDNVTAIQRIYPHISGTQEVLIEVGSHDHAYGPIRWKPGVKFRPGIDRKVDIRTTGELHAFRISSTGTEHWKCSGMDIEYALAGKR